MRMLFAQTSEQANPIRSDQAQPKRDGKPLPYKQMACTKTLNKKINKEYTLSLQQRRRDVIYFQIGKDFILRRDE